MTWAFSLPLEPRAKLTLLAIADHADDEGVAWPSRDRVAEKSSQSRATVIRRIKDLEELGLLALFQRFRKDGSQTTDEIRLDLTMTPEQVTRRTHGSQSSSDIDDTDEGRGCQADTPPSQAATPGVAVVTSPNEPSLEPSQSPNPLPNGQGGVEPDPEHFQGFFESCLSWRTMSRAKALAAFRFLTPDEQKLARAASPLHAEECTKAKRKSLDAHKLIAEQFWIKYPHARLPDAEREQQPQMRLMAGDELAGLRVAVRIAEQRELVVSGGIRSRKPEVQHDLAALARWADDSRREGWHIVEIRSSQFAAWRERLRFWCGGIEPKTERIWIEPHDPAVHDLPKLHPNFRLRKSTMGLRVPAPWPPRRDGSWSEQEGTA